MYVFDLPDYPFARGYIQKGGELSQEKERHDWKPRHSDCPISHPRAKFSHEAIGRIKMNIVKSRSSEEEMEKVEEERKAEDGRKCTKVALLYRLWLFQD